MKRAHREYFLRNLNNGGFTIIEILIAIILLSTIISGIIPLFTKAISTNQASRNKLYAYQSASAEIENMRNTSFAGITNHNFSVSGIGTATGTVTVSNVIDGSVQTGILDVTATVSWPFKGRNEIIQLKTYIAEKGMSQ